MDSLPPFANRDDRYRSPCGKPCNGPGCTRYNLRTNGYGDGFALEAKLLEELKERSLILEVYHILIDKYLHK